MMTYARLALHLNERGHLLAASPGRKQVTPIRPESQDDMKFGYCRELGHDEMRGLN